MTEPFEDSAWTEVPVEVTPLPMSRSRVVAQWKDLLVGTEIDADPIDPGDYIGEFRRDGQSKAVIRIRLQDGTVIGVARSAVIGVGRVSEDHWWS